MALQSRFLGPGFAMEFSGIDLGVDLSDGDFAEIRRLWLENKVAVFREQDLSDDALVRFTERFGPLFVHFRARFNDASRPEIMLVSNIKEDGKSLGELGDGDLAWHTDQAYSAEPVFSTLLYAVEVPKEGGATWFCDQARAWERLPDSLKKRVEGLIQTFSVERTVETQNIALSDQDRQVKPPVAHPLVRTHPVLGRKTLYLSPAHSSGIEGMDQSEAETLLGELLDWAERPEFVYRHDWRVGDLVMWDNTSTMHRRDAFDPAARRFLKRTGFEFPAGEGIPF